jgi:hypothetical protein
MAGRARFVGRDHGLGSVAQAEFGEDAADVGLASLVGDDEPGGDLRIGQPRR